MKSILIGLIQLYQWMISPLIGRNCRYTPSCSSYMKQAITQHGVIKGLCLGTKRLCRCHPLAHKHFEKTKGYDPVPEKKTPSS